MDRPRTPGIIYAVTALALVTVLAVFALATTQNPPPTIAEFAPQAIEQIRDAPQDQTSGNRQSGACASECDPITGLPLAPPPIDVPRVRRCVGDPPRQIEDPQSPPCVPYWSGENGGATTKGVTRDEVRIVWYSDQIPPRMAEAFGTFFNRRFEFYGRKIKLVQSRNFGGFSGSGSGAQSGARAAAVAADEEYKAFGSVSIGVHYPEEYARRKLLYVEIQPKEENKNRQAFSPYLWQYPTAPDDMQRMQASWLCKRLKGRPARWAGDPLYRTQPRSFGAVFTRFDSSRATGDWLVSSYKSDCGGTFAEAFGPDLVSISKSQQQGIEWAQGIVLRLKTAGVTSVVCNCHYSDLLNLSTVATQQAYFPEWIISSYLTNDINLIPKVFVNDTQSAAVFGLTFAPKFTLAQDQPAVWASKEADPGFNWWGHEYRSNSDNAFGEALNRYVLGLTEYRQQLLFASGIQMAGPRLTPQSFSNALHATRFPNPPHPIMSARVGFSPGSYAMTLDAAEIYYASGAVDPTDNSTGAYCYVEGGRRHRFDWPTDEAPLFQLPCDSGATPAQ